MATAIRFIMDVIAVIMYILMILPVVGGISLLVASYIFYRDEKKGGSFGIFLLALLLFLIAGGVFNVIYHTNFLKGSSLVTH